MLIRLLKGTDFVATQWNMRNEEHSWALFQCIAHCGWVKCYQIISSLCMHGMQSVPAHLDHPSLLKPLLASVSKLVGICCHQRQRLVITFFALTEQKEVLFCNLDGNRAASFHCCLRTGINVKLLYNQTSLNLKMPPKSPTEQSGLTLCSWTLTPKSSCDVRMQWQWHLCSVSHSYISKQQQNLFSSRSFQLSKRHFVLALENHCCHKDWAVLALLLSLHTPCTENSGVAVQGVCWWFTEMHLACDSSPDLWNNNDSSVWRSLVLLCCRVLPFTSGSLRGSFWSSRYLLQHQPANHREYTWGIELTGNLKICLFPNPLPMWHWRTTDGQLKMPNQGLVLPQCIWKATQSNRAELPACSQPSSALSQRCLKSICSWLRVTHKRFLWQPLELASPILNPFLHLQLLVDPISHQCPQSLQEDAPISDAEMFHCHHLSLQIARIWE